MQYLHYGRPNILGFKESDRDHLAWRVPIDDESGEYSSLNHDRAFLPPMAMFGWFDRQIQTQ